MTTAEGFGKRRLFEILDDLESQSRPILEAARARLAAEKGASALEPWNTGYKLAGAGLVHGLEGSATDLRLDAHAHVGVRRRHGEVSEPVLPVRLVRGLWPAVAGCLAVCVRTMYPLQL